MSNTQFIITNKKRTSLKPFFNVYQAKLKQDQTNNYFVQIYNRSKLQDPKVKEALQFNECIFSDEFQLSTSNIVRIIKKEQNDAFSAHFVEKYDKTLQQYVKDKKKCRVSEETCLMIMEDILKGLATILQAGYRPVSIRADNVVRCFSRNPQQRQQIWKIKNVVYKSNLVMQEQHFLTFEDNYSPPQIYGRRNCKDIEYEQSQEYGNALLVWSLGIILAKLLGVEGRLDSRKKLSEFKDREFNVMDILYIRNEYSMEFLKLMGSMLHFDHKKRIKLRDLYKQEIFSQEMSRIVNGKSPATTNSTIPEQVSSSPISEKISDIKKVVDEAMDGVWKETFLMEEMSVKDLDKEILWISNRETFLAN